MSKLAIIYHSAHGHTEFIARQVQVGALDVDGIDADLVKAEDIARTPDRLVDYDGFIFGSPTYLGGVSGPFKSFMDSTGRLWRTQQLKGKLAAGFTVSGAYSGDKLSTLQQFMLFAGQHSMLWASQGIMPGFNTSKGSIEDLNRVGSYSGLMVQANLDQGPEGIAASDFKTAEAFGARIATLAKRFAA